MKTEKKPSHTPGLRCWVRPSDATPYECPEHFHLYRAAPDMLAALKMVAKDYAGPLWTGLPSSTARIVHAAIAKAEGREVKPI